MGKCVLVFGEKLALILREKCRPGQLYTCALLYRILMHEVDRKSFSRTVDGKTTFRKNSYTLRWKCNAAENRWKDLERVFKYLANRTALPEKVMVDPRGCSCAVAACGCRKLPATVSACNFVLHLDWRATDWRREVETDEKNLGNLEEREST